MYPKPCKYIVKTRVTLREFISELGKDTLYAYDRRVIGVMVNGRKLWDSAKLESGDKIVIYPIIVGG